MTDARPGTEMGSSPNSARELWPAPHGCEVPYSGGPAGVGSAAAYSSTAPDHIVRTTPPSMVIMLPVM